MAPKSFTTKKNIYTNYHYKIKFLSCNFAHEINEEGRQLIFSCYFFVMEADVIATEHLKQVNIVR